MPAWSPGGARLSFDLRLATGSDIWVLDAKVLDTPAARETYREVSSTSRTLDRQVFPGRKRLRHFYPRPGHRDRRTPTFSGRLKFASSQ
jgi:hypothetical protein